jgi:prepilin-type N-terminal cleavage/methylation domain-containing protein
MSRRFRTHLDGRPAGGLLVAGFTLIEKVVGLTLIALLLTIAAPR